MTLQLSGSWKLRATSAACTAGLVALLVFASVTPVTGADDTKWGPFSGRFVDADTGEPIRGAVAYAIWLEIVPNPVHPTQKFYDVRFAVSDDVGAFVIPRRQPPMFLPSRIEVPLFDYAAARYKVVDVTDRNVPHRVIRMRSWGRIPQNEPRSTSGFGYHNFIPNGQRHQVLEAINEIRTRMGLRPFETLEGGV